MGRPLGCNDRERVQRQSLIVRVQMANVGHPGMSVSDFFPDQDGPVHTERVDILSMRGGAMLSRHYAKMSITQRALLLDIAEQLVRRAPE